MKNYIELRKKIITTLQVEFFEFLRGFNDTGRLIDALETLFAVFLSIALAQKIGATHVHWAAFSGYMVMRGNVLENINRGFLRITGTVAGALLAVLLQDTFRSLLISSFILMVVTGFTLYCALVTRHGYAWLFFGITFSMIVTDCIQHGDLSIACFAQSRIDEVMIGTFACVLISTLSTWLVRPYITPTLRRTAVPKNDSAKKIIFWHKAAFFNSLQGAIAMSAIPLFWQRFGIISLPQICITIMAIMMLPLNQISTAKHLAAKKIIHRFIGCLIGSLFGFAVLAITHENIYVIFSLLALGIVIGRIYGNGSSSYIYIGTQFALVVLIILVPDNYHTFSVTPGIERLSGIFFGIIILAPVKLISHFICIIKKTGCNQ